MAEKNFKVGESIEVQYQAGNGESGLTIHMEILKPDKTNVPGVSRDLLVTWWG